MNDTHLTEGPRHWDDGTPDVPPSPRRRVLTVAEAEAEGFEIDRHCFPWVAYKGPRFAPDECHDVEQPERTLLREALRCQNIFGHLDKDLTDRIQEVLG